jgi:hypothetical protein
MDDGDNYGWREQSLDGLQLLRTEHLFVKNEYRLATLFLAVDAWCADCQ